MNKIAGTVCILLLFFCSCRSKSLPEQKQDILALKEMSDLATAEYTITKVVKASDDQTWYKVGRRKILISCQASIKAGIDLSGIKEESIEILDKQVTLYLPPAKIITLNLPPENIRVEHEDIGPMRDAFSNEEQNGLMIQAEQGIRKAADSLGILQSAEGNAKAFIGGFLKRLGYTDVKIEFGTKPKTKKLG